MLSSHLIFVAAFLSIAPPSSLPTVSPSLPFSPSHFRRLSQVEHPFTPWPVGAHKPQSSQTSLSRLSQWVCVLQLVVTLTGADSRTRYSEWHLGWSGWRTDTGSGTTAPLRRSWKDGELSAVERREPFSSPPVSTSARSIYLLLSGVSSASVRSQPYAYSATIPLNCEFSTDGGTCNGNCTCKLFFYYLCGC